ncbi:MAG TPA: isochorismatase family protein [Methanotrichaceae archaeon]|nr:isochorismatase family protein [Methanotrichaceae archaeon]
MTELYITPDNIEDKTSQWLSRIASVNRSHLNLGSDKAALLVIDMQRSFTGPDALEPMTTAAAILPNVRRLIAGFRKAQRPVIFTRHIHSQDGSDAGILGRWWQDMILEGSPESEIDSRIAPSPGERIITKHRYSAFYNTDLEVILRGLNIEDLVISGVMTNLCCESTARDAFYRDYRVFFTADATATYCEEMHLASLLNLAYGFATIATTDRVLSSFKDSSCSG